VYGIFKQLGELQIPSIDQKPDLFTIDTLLFKEFTPETKAKNPRLLEVRRIAQGDKHQAIKPWETFEEAIRAIANLLLNGTNKS
jgi:hypothetical protein